MRLRELFDQELDELTGVKKYHDLTALQIMDKMSAELNLPKRGEGAFGKVIQSPDPNWVYKVFEKDSAYEEFVDFIAKNPNTHYPKIKKIKKMTSFFKRYGVQENKFIVVIIEKLEKIPEEKMNFVHELVNTSDVDDYPWYLPDGDANPDRITLETVMGQDWEGWKTGEMWKLWYAAQSIRKSDINRRGHFMDLHRGNIMQRADGTVVLIDPVASEAGLAHEKKIASAAANREPMVKGPHYKKQDAGTGPIEPSLHAPEDPGTTAWNNRPDATKPFPPRLPSDQLSPPWKDEPQKPLWSNADGKTKKAFEEWKELFYKTNRTPEEEQRFNRLNAYLDQKQKMRPPIGTPDLNFDGTNKSQWDDRPKSKKPINSTKEAKAEFDRIMNQTNKSTADLERAHELNNYLEKEYNRELGST